MRLPQKHVRPPAEKCGDSCETNVGTAAPGCPVERSSTALPTTSHSLALQLNPAPRGPAHDPPPVRNCDGSAAARGPRPESVRLAHAKVAASAPIASTDTRPLAPPVAGPTERVTLFVAHDDNGSCAPSPPRFPCPPDASSAPKNSSAPCSPSISTKPRRTFSATAPKSAASFWSIPGSPSSISTPPSPTLIAPASSSRSSPSPRSSTPSPPTRPTF